jgi:hypothetical protein
MFFTAAKALLIDEYHHIRFPQTITSATGL